MSQIMQSNLYIWLVALSTGEQAWGIDTSVTNDITTVACLTARDKFEEL